MIKTQRIIYTIRFQMHVIVFLSLEQNIHYKIGKCKLCRRVVTCVILFKTVVCSRELDVSTNAQEGLILTVNL